jgi:hypothetical protein
MSVTFSRLSLNSRNRISSVKRWDGSSLRVENVHLAYQKDPKSATAPRIPSSSNCARNSVIWAVNDMEKMQEA